MIKLVLLIMVALVGVESAIHVRNNRLVDDFGGELIFHGLNLVSKVFPYHTHFNETDMQLFQSLGINGIRLGVMWPGVEPQKGQFNETYLQIMKNTVEMASKYRIKTLVEFHQDLFSQKFCADGVPLWAIPTQISKGFPRPLNIKPFEYDENGYPKSKDCAKHAWSTYYFSNSVGKAFGALWTNKHGLRDLFIKYWRKVAETFKDSENVIAYELVNEPWPGDHFANPMVLVPGLSQKFHLQHAYDLISSAIREVDPDHSICFQPVTWLNNFKAGFTHPPGGRRHSNTSIFCYHYYNPPTLNLKKFMKARMKDLQKLQTAGLLSQFYVIDKQGQKNVEMINHCDANLQSWFGWLYNIDSHRNVPKEFQSQDDLHSILYNSNGKVNSQLVEGITRTYAQRVAGKTISQSFDPKTKKFVLVYEICTVCGNTSIFVSREHIYHSGFKVECFPSNGVRYELDGLYHVTILPKSIPSGTTVTITITGY